jgi:hypothetical protein
MMGLADGRILYETMHARIHPIGEPKGDVTYTALYDFLNCLEISPCACPPISDSNVLTRTFLPFVGREGMVSLQRLCGTSLP